MSETRITADQARDVVYARRDVFDRTLNIIRNMVDTKILEEAQRGGYSATITIPKSVFGREPYDYVVMGRGLAEQLYGDGFTVTGTFARMVITWGKDMTTGKRSTAVHPTHSAPSSSSGRYQQGGGIFIPIPKSKQQQNPHKPK